MVWTGDENSYDIIEVIVISKHKFLFFNNVNGGVHIVALTVETFYLKIFE